jgi:hypothetical protein
MGRIVRTSLTTNLPHPVAYAILAIVPLAVGVLLLVVRQAAYPDAAAARNWVAVPCVIEKSALGGESGPGALTVEYRYRFDGREFLGVRPDLSTQGSSQRGAQLDSRFVTRYPADSQAICYVDPTNPADAVLDRDSDRQSARNLLRLAYPFLCIGAGFSLGFLRCFARDRTAKDRESALATSAPSDGSKRQRKRSGTSSARQKRSTDIPLARQNAIAPPGPPPRKLGWLNSAVVLAGPRNLQFAWLFVVGFSYLFVAFFEGPAAFADLLNWNRGTELTTGQVTYVHSLNQEELDELVYEYGFTYEVDGNTYASKSYTRGRQYKEGDTVPVEYDPMLPSSAGISGARRQNLTWWYGAIPLGVLVLLALGLVGMYWHSFRTLRVLRSGLVGKATRREQVAAGADDFVTAVAALSPYEFHVAGRNYRARHYCPDSGKQDSTDVILLYDPKSPKRNVIFDEHLSGLLGCDPGPSVLSRMLDCVNGPLAIIAVILLAFI